MQSRKEKDLTPLELDSGLTRFSQEHAHDMLEHNYIRWVTAGNHRHYTWQHADFINLCFLQPLRPAGRQAVPPSFPCWMP